MNSLPYSVGQPVVFGPGGGWQKPTMAMAPPMWTGSGWSHDPMMDEQQDPMQEPMQQQDPMQSPQRQRRRMGGSLSDRGAYGQQSGSLSDRGAGANRHAMPFGGFRAQGGPVRPGRKYVVGEEGPETFVPNQPGMIVPNRGTPPPASDPIARQGALVGTGAGWRDHVRLDQASQIRAEEAMARVREQRKGRPGSDVFSGPLMPPLPAPNDPRAPTGGFVADPNAPTGRLVAGPGGSTKWERGTGTGSTPPPQSGPPPMSAAGQVPAGMAPGPMLIRNGAKTMNANQTGPLSGRGTQGMQGGPLSTRLPVPVGRSANDPMRIAEQMRRRGDPRALLQMGMQQRGQDFAREQNATNFDQGLMMYGMQRQDAAAQDAQRIALEEDRWNRSQQATDQREQRGWSRADQLRAEDIAREEAARQGTAFAGVENVPSPDGRGYVPVQRLADGTAKPIGGYMPNPREPEPMRYTPVEGTPYLAPPPGSGLPPMQQVPNPGWSVTKQPKTRLEPLEKTADKPPGFTFEKDDNGRITGGVYPIQKEDGSWSLQRVDINGDGKVNPAEAALAESAAAALPAEGVTRSGLKFKPL